ncbi:hypothetical protein Q31a_35080 [Aureliella helgolandensis]|uniref:Uncharacterized protein n=2 Tax=Aureliella helgolandensis TaxID=2527968 RepID=A0A518G9B1_9BACT|nr:hypothetical protein Q31a_35080 [Aureliella helgolandensis]
MFQQDWNQRNVGGVVIGDMPNWMDDNMPSGGSKDRRYGPVAAHFKMRVTSVPCNLALRTPEQ